MNQLLNNFYERKDKYYELLIIFIILPIFSIVTGQEPINNFISMYIISTFYWYFLYLNKVKIFNNNKYSERHVIITFIAIFIFSFSYCYDADNFMVFPKENPLTFLLVIFLYPFLSVVPQEIIFRKYFFFKFNDIMPRNYLIFINGLVFSLAHVFFNNYIAIIFTFFGGIYLSWSYLRSESLTLVIYEHTLFGIFIFASGLGRYFYHAV